MGLYCLLICETTNKQYWFLSIGMSLVVYSHILSFVVTSILVGIIFISVIFLTNDRLIRVVNFIKSIVGAILLSSFQLVMIIEQFLANKIMSPSIYSLNDSTNSFTDLFSSTGTISHNHLGIMIVISYVILMFFAFFLKNSKV